MADIFGQNTGRGVVVRYRTSEGVQASSIANVPGFSNSANSSVFLIDFSATSTERLALMPCFGNTTYIFAYGHDLSTSRSSCSMLIFLGSTNCTPGDNTGAVSSFLDFYKNNRISETGSRVPFSICGNSGFASGYLVSMTVKAYNPDLNAITVTATFMSASPS